MAESAPDEGAFAFLPRLSRDDLRNQIRGWEYLTTRYLMRARWLFGSELLLGGARPIDVLALQGSAPVVRALEGIAQCAYS